MKPYYYDEDGITIYYGDCREILPQLGQVDVVITDPPYSDQTHDGALSKTQNRSFDWTRKTVTFKPIIIDELRAIFESIQLKRWCVSFLDYHHAVALETEPPTGLRSVRIAIWVKPNPTPQFSGDRPSQGWESIGIFHAADTKMRWNGGGISSVFTECKVQEGHATAKPLRLVTRLMALFSEPGELILDPFMGSGTTLVAAKNLGRRAIGIEIEEKYCEVAARRLAQRVFPFVAAK